MSTWPVMILFTLFSTPNNTVHFVVKESKTIGIKYDFKSIMYLGVKTSILNCWQEVTDCDHFNISKPLMLKTCVMIGSTLNIC